MRTKLFAIVATFLCLASANAQEVKETMVIEKKDGTKVEVFVADIAKVKFEDKVVPTEPDYSGVKYNWNDFVDLDVRVKSCTRSGNIVTLVYTIENTNTRFSRYIKIYNAQYNYTVIKDDCGNQYAQRDIWLELDGTPANNQWGRDVVTGELLPASKAYVTVKVRYADINATRMDYSVWTTIAPPGGGVYCSDRIIIQNVPIY